MFKELFLLYIDPGTGSLLLQVILGGIIAGSLFIKNKWAAFTDFFKRKK